jgi:hypothetical protein
VTPPPRPAAEPGTAAPGSAPPGYRTRKLPRMPMACGSQM